MSVGIVIPAYRAEAFIADTVRSLLSQTCQQWECVVVVDGSPDASAELARSTAAGDPRITVLEQPNAGVAHARNNGLAELSSAVDRVVFLDADDTLLPTSLASLSTALDARPDAVGVFGLADYVDSVGRPLRPGEHPARQLDRRRLVGRRLRPLSVGADSTFEDLVVYNPIWPPSIALGRRSVLQQVGGFDQRVRLREDWDMFLRMSRQGPWVQLTEVVGLYRQHDKNATGKDLEGRLQQELLRRKSYLSPDNTPATRRSAGRAGQRVRAAEVRTALVRLRCAVATGDAAGAGQAVVGAVWTLLTVLRPCPPRPSTRRHRWTTGVTATDVWHPATDRVSPIHLPR